MDLGVDSSTGLGVARRGVRGVLTAGEPNSLA